MTEPKYDLGDRLPGTNINVCGRTTISDGSTRYFLQAGDNTFVVSEDDLEEIIIINQFVKKDSTANK